MKHVEGNGAPIAIAAHSGPWHLRQTIRGSMHYTTNMEEADIVYVYDHCYYMRWLGQVGIHVMLWSLQCILPSEKGHCGYGPGHPVSSGAPHTVFGQSIA